MVMPKKSVSRKVSRRRRRKARTQGRSATSPAVSGNEDEPTGAVPDVEAAAGGDFGNDVPSVRELMAQRGSGDRDALFAALTGGWEPPPQYDLAGAADKLGLALWQFEVAVRLELIPDHGGNGCWSERVLNSVTRRIDEIRDRVGTEPPAGANRAAERIMHTLGIPFTANDFRALARRGVFMPVSEYHGWPTYSMVDIDDYCARSAEQIRRDSAERDRRLANQPPRTAPSPRIAPPLRVEVADRVRGSTTARIRAQQCVSSKPITPTPWEVLQAKLIERLAASRAPSLNRADAAALAAEVRLHGVELADLGNPEGLKGLRPWDREEIAPGSPEHIAVLCAWLEASVAYRFAANLRRSDVQVLLQFIASAGGEAGNVGGA